MRFPSMLSFYRFLAFAFILAGSGYFGYLARPAEMALAIVAGSIALAFSYIDKIQRFKGAGFEAEMRQQLEVVVAKETEPPRQSERSFIQVKAFGTDPDTDKVIKALGSEKYAWRYFGGIAVDTQLPKEKIQKSLDWLVENELATRANGKDGSLWGLLAEGRSLLASVVAAEKNRDA
jgi:hypothetical protein